MEPNDLAAKAAPAHFRFLALANAERARRGLPPMTPDARLHSDEPGLSVAELEAAMADLWRSINPVVGWGLLVGDVKLEDGQKLYSAGDPITVVWCREHTDPEIPGRYLTMYLRHARRHDEVPNAE
jgi:hypothetical protein